MALSEKKQKRLNLFRYGLLVVTCVAFALGTTLVWIGSRHQLGTALLQGILLGAGTAVVCTIIYFLYRSYLEKSA
jgi:hypothetical protein